jgi:glycosyltransferase involved in cell wall biosynthesis
VTKVLRIWDESRTSHFELLHKMTPSTLVYRRRNYSFHARIAEGLAIEKRGWLSTTGRILFGDYDVLELNEPTMIRILPLLLVYTTAYRIRKRLSHKHDRAVLYAIDNVDLRDLIGSIPWTPKRITYATFRTAFRYMITTFDRIAFGTRAALKTYESVAPMQLARIDHVVIEQLPAPCDCPKGERDRHGVLFVGALEERKGVLALERAWEVIAAKDPTASLSIVGKGELEHEVEAWVKTQPRVTLSIDPDRAEIHAAYRRAHVVVLLSVPSARWREQVGLPIVEGLAHGCEIVTSSETGLADQLREHGHVVLPALAPPNVHADGILTALSNTRPASAITGLLPTEHGRKLADDWLLN